MITMILSNDCQTDELLAIQIFIKHRWLSGSSFVLQPHHDFPPSPPAWLCSLNDSQIFVYSEILNPILRLCKFVMHRPQILAHLYFLTMIFKVTYGQAWIKGQPPFGLPPIGLAPIGLPPFGLNPIGLGLPPIGLSPFGLPPIGLPVLKSDSRKKSPSPPFTSGFQKHCKPIFYTFRDKSAPVYQGRTIP